MSTIDIITEKLNKKILVTEDDIKVHTPMSANKSLSSLVNHIVVSQDLHIKKILGITLFNQLMAEWIANNMVQSALPDGTNTGTPPQVLNDTTNYKELHEQIFSPLVWWSYVLSLSSIAFQIGEAGILSRSTDNAESGGIEGLKKLVADGEAIARAYTKELVDYIELTFKDDNSVQSESKEVGAPSMGVFVPKKPWHGNKSNY